jgi:hypothetical protein
LACLHAEYFRQRKAAGYVDEWPATVLGWQRPDIGLAAVILDELGLETVIKVNLTQAQSAFNAPNLGISWKKRAPGLKAWPKNGKASTVNTRESRICEQGV